MNLPRMSNQEKKNQPHPFDPDHVPGNHLTLIYPMHLYPSPTSVSMKYVSKGSSFRFVNFGRVKRRR